MADLILNIEAIDSSRLIDVAPVPVKHTNDATYCISADGRRWVRKREDNMGWQEFFAEVVGYLLARRLSVPVPCATVCLQDGQRSWLSEFIPDVTHWHTSRIPFINNLEALGSTLTLDAIIGNQDRHAGNILLQPDPDQTHLYFWSIDMGAALIGHFEDYEKLGLAPPSVHNLARGIPIDLDAVSEGALNTALTAGRLTEQEITDIVSYSCYLVKEKYDEKLTKSLHTRCKNATRIVDSYISMMRGT